MRTKHTIETGTYRVRFAAHSGLGAYDVAEGLDRSQAVRAIVRFARRRKATGHPIAHSLTRRGLPEYDISEPDDCAMIPDTAGIAWVEPEVRPAYECFECGDLVAVGDSCSCSEPAEDDRDVDNEDEDEESEAY